MTARLVAALAAIGAMAGPSARAEELLTLAQAEARAKAHHPTVEAQRAQVQIERARTEQAIALLTPSVTGHLAYDPQTANYAPTPAAQRALTATTGADTVVDSAGMATLVTCRTPGMGNCQTIAAPPTSATLYDYWTASLGVAWTIWDWGRSIHAVGSAATLQRAAEVGVETTQRDAVLAVRLAYFATVAAGEQLRVGQESVADYKAHLEQIEAFHQAGLRTGIDVATAQSALASAEITLARATAGLRVAEAQLGVALGDDSAASWRLQPASELFVPATGDEESARREEPGLVELGLRQRTELRALRLQVSSFEQLARGARGQYLPQLTLTLGPDWGGSSLDGMVGNLEVMLMIGYPITGMNPLAVHGQSREAAAQGVQTAARLREEQEAIRGEVIGARAQLASALDELRAAQTMVEAAKRQRDLAQGRYSSGVGNIIELSDALLNYANARFQLVQAGYDLAGARARLAHATGEEAS